METKVYSEYPVIIQHIGSGNGGDFSSMDGSTSPREILAFQKWTNKFKFKKRLLVEDGIWGPKTSAAWNQFGQEYLAAGAKVAGIMDAFGNQFNTPSSTTTSDAATQSKPGFFDKLKNAFGKAQDLKTKAQGLAGKAQDLKNQIGSGAGTGTFGDDSMATMPDADQAKKDKTKKMLIIGGVAAGLIILTIIIVKANKSKSAKA